MSHQDVCASVLNHLLGLFLNMLLPVNNLPAKAETAQRHHHHHKNKTLSNFLPRSSSVKLILQRWQSWFVFVPIHSLFVWRQELLKALVLVTCFQIWTDMSKSLYL